MKYFPMNYQASVQAIAPFLVLLASALFLREYPTMMQFATLMIVVSLNTCFILCGENPLDQVAENRPEWSDSERRFAWTCLICMPISGAMGQILMRAMRDLDEMTVGFYGNFMQLSVTPLILLAQHTPVTYIFEFTPAIIVLIVVCGVLIMLQQKQAFVSSQTMPIPER